MVLINADLHIHSRFSMSTSKFMTFQTLAEEAPKKGIHLVGSGDCLHPKWLSELKALESVDDGTFELLGTRFIPTVEVQAIHRVHHLLMFPNLDTVDQFRDSVKTKSKNIDSDGRPHVPISGAELGDLAMEVGALFGPCHAFTPWTGMYGYYDSLRSCYQERAADVSFLELGLSADSSYANRLVELDNITLLSNSDAHSPYPLRLGREFNQFEVQEVTFAELKKAILRQGGRKCTLNVGLPPAEGKYNQSACSKCYSKFSFEDCISQAWKCSCGGRIKKGVFDRVLELGASEQIQPPKHRPEYLHLIPLAEIISKALDLSSTNCVGVKKNWDILISRFDNEISILMDAKVAEISGVTNNKIGRAIQNFRDNKIILHPGGGGKYGEIELPKYN